MEMSRDAKKAWLSRYSESVKKQQQLLDTLNELRSRATSLSYSLGSAKSSPTGSHSDRVGDNAIKIADLERALQQEQERGDIIAIEIIKALYRPGYPSQYADVLHKHYIEGMSITQIAYETWSTQNRVSALKRNALDRLKLDIPEIETIK